MIVAIYFENLPVILKKAAYTKVIIGGYLGKSACKSY